MKKATLFLLFIVLLSTLTFAAPNPRLGDNVAEFYEVSLVVDLAKCYEQKVEDSEGLSFGQYLEKGVISEDCQSTLDSLKTAYEEQLKVDYTLEIPANVEDTDGDKFTDIEEMNSGTNLNDPADFPWWTDVDGDGFHNEDELFSNTDPKSKEDIPDFKYLRKNRDNSWAIYLTTILIVFVILGIIIYFKQRKFRSVR